MSNDSSLWPVDWPKSIDSWPDPEAGEAQLQLLGATATAERWEATVKAARSNLLDFTEFTFPGTERRPYVVNWHHRILASALDRAIKTPGSRTMVLLPPQVGKTELATRRAAAYALGRNPEEQVIAATYNSVWAKRFGVDVQEIIRSWEYGVLFPGVRLKSKTEQGFFKIIDHGGFFKAVGREQGIAGWPGSFCLIDDLLKDQSEAYSAAAREECWRFFVGEILRRIGEDARIFVTNTRRSRDDLCGGLMRLQPERWEIIELPSIRKAAKTHPDDPREPGEALWARHKSLESLEEEKRMDPVIFAAVDQQDPSEAGGTDWPPSLFEHVLVSGDQWPKQFDARIVACDPSKGKRDKAGDYTAMIFLGFAQHLLWVAADLDRPGLDRLVGRLIGWCDQWKPDALGIEAEAFQEFLALAVEQEMRKAGRSFGLQWTPHLITSEGVKKEVRIRRLSPYIADRKIRILDDPGGRLLVEQLMDFPTGEHDDGPDALEMAVRLAGEVCVAR